MPSGLPGDTRAMLGLPLRHLVNYLLSQGSDCNSGRVKAPITPIEMRAQPTVLLS